LPLPYVNFHINVVGLITIFQNKTCSKIRVAEGLSDTKSIQNVLKQQALFHHYFSPLPCSKPLERSKKSRETEIGWGTSVADMCWWCQYIEQKHNFSKGDGEWGYWSRSKYWVKSRHLFMSLRKM